MLTVSKQHTQSVILCPLSELGEAAGTMHIV